MTLNIGEQAPDFSLKTKNAEGLKDISLSDHKDKQSVVLLFFPFAFTSVCTEETCSVRDDLIFLCRFKCTSLWYKRG